VGAGLEEATVGSNKAAAALEGVGPEAVGDPEAAAMATGSVGADTDIFAFKAG
jgi:hypothetical protein